MKISKKFYFFTAFVFLCILAFWLFLNFGGRTPSRYLGQSARQVIKISDMQTMVGNINMWFDKANNATVKTITYCSKDGYYYSAEFRDASPFEGTIRWVPYQQGSDLIQSRKLSRWGVDIVNLKVPENFRRIYGVSIVSKENSRVKNLTYFSSEETILVKEYREGLLERFLTGYVEVRSNLLITPPPETKCDATYLANK